MYTQPILQTFPSQSHSHEHHMISQPDITIHYSPQRHMNPQLSSSKILPSKWQLKTLNQPGAGNIPYTTRETLKREQHQLIEVEQEKSRQKLNRQMQQQYTQSNSQIIPKHSNQNHPRFDSPQKHQQRFVQSDTHNMIHTNLTMKLQQNWQQPQIQHQHQRSTSSTCVQQKQVMTNTEKKQHQKQTNAFETIDNTLLSQNLQ